MTPGAGEPPEAATPMLAQYLAAKRAHPDALLFFRMGDFYELFFEDARVAAAALGIALTRRGQYEGQDVPMAGVPVHAALGYLHKLIGTGHRVAICEQLEDPREARKRGAKSVVRREVVRVVTPGTLTEDGLLDAARPSYLAALAEVRGALGLAWVEISTGAFHLQPLPPAALAAALARIEPAELILPRPLVERPELFEALAAVKDRLTLEPDSRFALAPARQRLDATFGLAAAEQLSAGELAAAGALLEYLDRTQAGRMPRLAAPRRLPAPGEAGAAMEIDAATRRNLELTRALSGERAGSLIAAIDRTVTPMGARLLSEHLAAPLTEVEAIHRRQEMAAHFLAAEPRRQAARRALARAPDASRALGRLLLARGGPRDLALLRDALAAADALKAVLAGAALAGEALAPLPAGIAEAAGRLGQHQLLVDRLKRALGPELPRTAEEGGFIAPGYAPALDEERKLAHETQRVIAALEARYAQLAQVPALKVKHNRVLGYFVEVKEAQAAKLIGPGTEATELPFVHRQTMAGAVRFATAELAELEQRIARAEERALALESALFDDLLAEVRARADDIARAAEAMAALDVAAAHAELAAERGFCRPVVTRDRAFRIEGGRHPVVEAALARAHAPGFVANDCDLSARADGGKGRLWLVTGPNMAGKSTFLRQNALIAVMAQIGAFVPARAATLGVVDRLFSRVGAADDLARGRSTFMVEMVETATILRQATDRSLVILDEIGRGTATFDGLSIAWATLEHLHDRNCCRGLFATHFHELTRLTQRLPELSGHALRVKEWKGEVVFLHEVKEGAADRSYGLHVARLAGLPEAVTARAQEILARLEAGDGARALARLADDLPLFAPPSQPPPTPRPSAVEAALAHVDPDRLSPREALEALYRLKSLEHE